MSKAHATMAGEAVKQKTDTLDELAEIVRDLRQNSGLLDVVRAEADKAMDECKRLWQAPFTWIFWKRDRINEELHAANIRLAPGKNDLSTEERLQQDAQHFRIYRSASEAFNDLAARWTGTPMDLRVISSELQREIEQREFAEMFKHSNAVTDTRPTFDAGAFVEGLAARGIVLAAGKGDGLTAMPASKLTTDDRSMIEAHRSAVRDAVRELTATL